MMIQILGTNAITVFIAAIFLNSCGQNKTATAQLAGAHSPSAPASLEETQYPANNAGERITYTCISNAKSQNEVILVRQSILNDIGTTSRFEVIKTFSAVDDCRKALANPGDVDHSIAKLETTVSKECYIDRAASHNIAYLVYEIRHKDSGLTADLTIQGEFTELRFCQLWL
jgi:hypothetical protein